MMICLTTSVGALRLHTLSQLSVSRIGVRRGVDVLDQALVDAHLVAVPGLGTLTTRGLASGDLQDLGRETDGALDAEVLGLGALDELGSDCTQPSF